MKKTSRDLTEGNIWLQFVLFVLPIFAGQIFQSFYNSIDALVVGKNVGKTALAAVTSSNDISQMMIGFFSGVANGAGVVFSRLFGKKDIEKLKETISTTIIFSFVMGLFMTVAAIMIAPWFLKVISCPDDVFPEALSYLRIYLIGIEFTCLYNIFSAVLRSVGDSGTPFNYLVISSCANIILDYLFVKVFDAGVNGVAFATVIAQCLSVVLIITKMLRTADVYRLDLHHLIFKPSLLKEIILLGIPGGLQASLTNLSNMSVQKWTNYFGSSAMAGAGAAKKIDKFLNSTTSAVSYGTATFIAQNHSSGKTDRVRKGIYICLAVALIPTVLMGSFIMLNEDRLLKMFIEESEAINIGKAMINTLVPHFAVQGIYHVLTYVIRGFGESIPSMVISVSGLIIIRQIYLQYTMHNGGSIQHVFFSYPVGWWTTAILAVAYVLIVIRKKYLVEKS